MMRTNPTSVLRALVAFTIVSTAIHFTHNVVEIESYPSDPFSDTLVQVAAIAAPRP